LAIAVVGNYFGRYDPKIVTDIYMTNSEAGVLGAAYNLSSQRWSLAATTEQIDAICVKASTAGTDVLGTMEIVKPGDILEMGYTGTPNAAFIKGLKLATLDAAGLLADATAVTAGHLVILYKDTTDTKVRCLATKHFGYIT
jgi:hypothetical protein